MSTVFNESRAAQVVALDICKAFDKVWHTCLFHKLRSYEISSLFFGFLLSFLSLRWLRKALDDKFSQKYSVNICNITIYVNDSTLKTKGGCVSDFWEELEPPSEHESDLQDNMN